MTKVSEITSQAIADLIEYYKPAGGKIDEIEANIGDLITLTTEEKETLVKSINEVLAKLTPIKKEVEDARSSFATLDDRIQEVNNNATLPVDVQRIGDNSVPASKFKIASNSDRIKLANLADEVLQAMAGSTPVNSTPAVSSVTTDKIAPKAITPDKFGDSVYSERLTERLSIDKNNLIYGADGDIVLDKMRDHTNDPYFYTFNLNPNELSKVSITSDQKFRVDFDATYGIWFYKLRCVNKIAPGSALSLAIKMERDHIGLKKQYQFNDASGAVIVSRYTMTDLGDGWFGAQNISVPSNATVLEFRIDFRAGAVAGDYVLFTDPTVLASKYLDRAATTKEKVSTLSDRASALETRATSAEARLTDIESGKAGLKRQIRVLPPNGFSWSDTPINIYTDGEGTFETDFDVSTYQVTGKTYYVNLSTGLDTNDGLTPETPFKRVQTATQKSDVDVIEIESGVYTRNNALAGLTITRNMTIKAAPGADVTLSTHETLSWSLAVGFTKTYRASRTSISRVFDSKFLDVEGDYTELTLRNSIAEVEASPGSYYTDSTYVYVQTQDSRPVDSQVIVFLAVNNLRHIGGKTIYLEGIKFEGGNYPLRVENTATELFPKVYAKNCKFKYGKLGNGAEILGAQYAFFQDCEIAKSNDDGFNYHMSNGTIPKAIEVNCIGRNNGTTSDTDNGSTMHDGGKIIRINGAYYRNKGPNVADVNDGSESWNINCVAFESQSSLYPQNSDFQSKDGAAKIWLDSCIAYGSPNSLYVDTNSFAYVRNNKFDQSVTVSGTKANY